MAAITITSQPSDMVAIPSGRPVFRVVASGSSLKYQWEYSDDSGTTWANSGFTGNKTANMTVTATVARNGYLYRCKITSGSDIKYSRAAELICTDGTISNQLNRINKGIEGIATAIESKGGTVASGAHINALSALVNALPIGKWQYLSDTIPTLPNAHVNLDDIYNGDSVGDIIRDSYSFEVDLFVEGIQLLDIGRIDFQIIFVLVDTASNQINGVAIGSYNMDGDALQTICFSDLAPYPGVSINFVSDPNGVQFEITIDQSDAEAVECEWRILSINM